MKSSVFFAKSQVIPLKSVQLVSTFHLDRYICLKYSVSTYFMVNEKAKF